MGTIDSSDKRKVPSHEGVAPDSQDVHDSEEEHDLVTGVLDVLLLGHYDHEWDIEDLNLNT